jgi:hypothetical protein
MFSRRPSGLAAVLIVSLAACGGGGGGGGGGGPTSGPDVDFAPTSNTSLSGNLTYKSVRIPAGVTVTGSADLTLTVVGDALIAGGLTSPCHALTVTAGGVLTVSGSVDNSCTVAAQRGSQLALIGKGGYDFEGAHIKGSGNVAIVDGPNLNPSAEISKAAFRSTGRADANGPYRCKLVNTTVDMDPPQPKAPGADGVTDGADGLGYIDGCGQLFTGQTGGNLLINGLTVNGSAGLNGSDATGVASARGGNGGNAGPIALVSDEDIDITGNNNNFNGGDGGRGGDATAANPAAGGNATATGGKGGSLKPPGGIPPVVIVSNQGTITVSGALAVTLGTAGRGGHANATSGDGASGGGKGGTANATGGDGGDGQAANVNAAGAVTITGSITVSGGGGGNGGDATISVGDGGPATTAGSPGGPGGAGVQRGGKGGKGVTNGALRAFRADGTEVTVVTQNAPGGNGGKATATKGNGKNGADNCNPPGKGGDGGAGGGYSGGPGAGGDGTPKGTVGSWGISNAFNGLNGAKGATGGARGAAGTDGSSAPPGVTGYNPTETNSFQAGQPGGTCGLLTSFTLTPPTETVAIGGSGSVHGTFTRLGTTGALLATLTDQTGGMRGSTSVSSVNSSFDISFSIPTNFPAGTGNWTVSLADAASLNVPTLTATFQVTVGQPTGTPITVQNLDPLHPIIWFAIEHGNGPWLQLSSSNQTFSWTETDDIGGFAYTVDEGNDRYRTWRILARTPTEEEQAANILREYGTNTVGGLLRGLNTNERAFATIGSNVRSFLQSGTGDVPVVWSNQPAGTFDIFASRVSTGGDALKLIQMRGQAVPAGTSIFMDFGGTAAFNPFAAFATGSNFGSEQWNVESGVWTQTGPTIAPFALSAFSGSITKNLWFLPPTLETATDLEFVAASTPTRSVEGFFHTPGNQTINFPSQINPSLAWVGTRPHITLTFPSDVNQLVTSDITESVGGSTIQFTSLVSTAFTGNTTAFDDVLPDWSSIGFPAAAMFRSGGAGSYSIIVQGSNMTNGALLSPREGLWIYGAQKVGTTTVP